MGQTLGEGFRSWEAKYLPASWLGVEPVAEEGDGAVRLEEEGQRTTVGREVVRQTCGVFGGLGFHAGERAFGLRFHRTQRLTVEIEQVIGEAEARLHRKFPDS